MSHLQQLREQEERVAREEEEEEEAMSLTYDRPELVNKVVFRRNKDTGSWEVSPMDRVTPQLDSNASRHRPKHGPPSCGGVTPNSVAAVDPDYTPVSGKGRRGKASPYCTTTPSTPITDTTPKKRVSTRFHNSDTPAQVNHTPQCTPNSLHAHNKTIVNSLSITEDTPNRRSTRLRY